MPERELAERLRARLAAELTAGAPLLAPLPSQARYAGPSLASTGRHVRGRLVAAATAACALLVVAAFAGPAEARQWIGTSVDNIVRSVEHGGGLAPSSPHPAGSTRNGQPGTNATQHESPEPSVSPASAGSPEPQDSPEPAPSPGDHESPEPSPSPEPADSQDGGPDGSGGGGDGSATSD